MIKKILCTVMTVVMAFSLVACSGNQQKGTVNPTGESDKEKTKITFCLDWTPNTNHTGLYVALEKGYFEDAGLDVTIVQPAESTSALMVAGGQAQFGIEAQDTMAAALIGDSALGITAVASIIQHNTSGIMSLKGNGIESPKGLENKQYSTWDSPIELAMLEYLVNKDGGNFENVKLIPNTITDEPGALKEKQTDAIWVFYGWGGIYAEKQGVDIDYFDFITLDSVFDYYTPVIIANDDFLKDSPDTAKAFLAAVKKGYEYAIENPVDAAKILIKQVPEIGSEDFIVASQTWLSQQYQADAASWGVIDGERWNAFYRWLNDNNLVESPIPENAGFSMDYLG